MTGKVAPHEGTETELVLSGEKPLAAIERAKDAAQYLKARTALQTDRRLQGTITYDEVVITFDSNLLSEYSYLQRFGVADLGRNEYNRRMGRLFGYSEEDIEEFIATCKCECRKCTGLATQDPDTEQNESKLEVDARKARSYDFTGSKS